MNSTADAVLNPDSFAAMFEESLTRKEMRAGELITAQVVRIDHNVVVVNAGLKSESWIPVEEFLNDKGELEVAAGDFVTVAIESLENGYGRTSCRVKKPSVWLHGMILRSPWKRARSLKASSAARSKAVSPLWSTVSGCSCWVHWWTSVQSRTPRRTKTRPWNSRSSSWIVAATT